MNGKSLLILGFLLLLCACSRHPESDYEAEPSWKAPPDEQKDLALEVPPPPFSEGIFPCSECHKDLETNPNRRKLEDAHDDIVLTHDEEHRWCLDCHDAQDRDKLHLASGAKISFEESYKLCGQCHGDKYRDWRFGVHGRRTGLWNGKKGYLLCAHCHNPHQPHFKPIKPLPPPVRPEVSHGR
ncbi:MAG: hypothetical protein A2Z34_04100 [Planctomycetes bacterium RBG_16_59_8]|nr:MAG: hypothetical protein A2Z34_04100 [Planctomycetes bacterium RBG_16_59_8]